MSLLDEIYEAESVGDVQKADELRQKLAGSLQGILSLSDIKHDFFRVNWKRPFRKTFTVLLQDELDDLTCGKALSSFITHALIEMGRVGNQAFEALSVPEATRIQMLFVTGECGYEKIREFVSQFKEYITPRSNG